MQFSNRCFLFIPIFYFLSTFSALAQPTVSIADTTARRGDTILIRINATLAEQAQVSLSLRYNPQMLKILGLQKGELSGSVVMKNDVPSANGCAVLDTALLTATMNPAFQGTDKTLLLIRAELLAGNEATAKITPISLRIDGKEITNATIRSGEVVPMDAAPVTALPQDGLFQNYPNPFFDNSTFEYVIGAETPVFFKIFSTGGRMVLTLDEGIKTCGRYTLAFPPPAMRETLGLAQGVYKMQMETKQGVFSKIFHYVK